MDANEVAILVKARDEASKTFKDVTGEANGLQDALKGVAAVAGGIGLADLAKGAPEALGGVVDLLDQGAVSAGQLQAKLGLTKEEAAELGEVAKEVYRDNFGASLEEVTQQVAAVSQGLGLQGDALRDTVADINRVTDAFGEQGADSQLLIDDMRTLKGAYPGKSERELMDLVTKGFQMGLGASGDYLDTLQEYPSHFAAIGLSGEDMIGFLNEGMKAGARNTDLLADAVKEFGIRIKTEGDTAQLALAKIFPPAEAQRLKQAFAEGGEAGRAAFFQVMEQLANTRDEQERYNLAIQLFGTKGEDLVGVLDRMGPGLADIRDRSVETAGATESLDAQYAGFAGTLEGAKRQMAGFIADALGPAQPLLVNGAAAAVEYGGGILEIGSSVGIMTATAVPAFKALIVGATGFGTAIKGAALATAAASPVILAVAAAATVAYLAFRQHEAEAKKIEGAVASLADKEDALRQVEEELAGATGVRARKLGEVKAEIERQIEAEHANAEALARSEQKTRDQERATEDAKRASGDFGQAVKDLNTQLDTLTKNAGDAFGALDKFKTVPTQEQIELNAAIAQNNADLATHELRLYEAKKAGDALAQGIEQEIIAKLKDEQEKLGLTKQSLDANRDSAVEMGKAKLGASGQVADLTRTEGELLGAVDGATGALARQMETAEQAAWRVQNAALAAAQAIATMEIAAQTAAGVEVPVISPGALSAPANAEGTRNWPGGWSWVGERGPELMYVPRGSDIYSNGESRRMVSGESGGATTPAGGFVNYGTLQLVLPNVRSSDDLLGALDRLAVPG